MSPNRKREAARIALWAITAMTLVALWGQIAWLQKP